MTEVMYLPGVAGHYASTPDSAALSITGDIDIRCKVAMNDWTPSASQALVAKYTAAGNLSYLLWVNITDGKLQFTRSSDGTATTLYTSSVTTGVSDGSAKWVRAARASATGTTQFFLSDDGTTWTQLGTDVAGSSGAIFDSSGTLEIGARNIGTAALTAGRFHRAQVLNGIDGTVVFDADFTDRGNSFVEDSSNHATVTIWGRLQGYEPTWLPAEAFYGNANHYGYEAKKLDAPEPAPKTNYPTATGGTTYPVAR